MAKKEESQGTIQRDIGRLEVILRNKPNSPLVVHQFSEKAKKEIRDKQQKRATQKKEARDPQKECEEAKYLDAQGRECLPVMAIKKAIVSAARAFEDLKMTEIRQALFVSSAHEEGSMLAPILTPDDKPAKGEMREDAVTIGRGIRGLTYRPEYAEWSTRCVVEFNRRMLSEEQVLALLEEAGWGVGICEGRPEKTSALGWGRFDVEKVED